MALTEFPDICDAGPTIPRPARSAAVTVEAPLLGIDLARLALKCDEDDVMKRIASGDLEWAFDLRNRTSNRAFIRIWTDSVALAQQRPYRLTAEEKLRKAETHFGEVFDTIFRHHKAVLLSTDIMRVWNCSSAHVLRLVEDGQLEMLKKDYGKNEALHIPRASVAKFMAGRRIK